MILISGNLYADGFILLDLYPSANLYGLYSTGASRISDDTYSCFANPALSSLTLTPNMLSVNYGSGEVMNSTDRYSDNFAITLNQDRGKWTYGFGIFHQSIDMGDIFEYKTVNGEWVNVAVGKNPKNYQTGVNFSSTVGSKFKFGFGLNLKYIYIGGENNPNPNPSSSIFGTDLGMICSYNILENKKISDKMGIDLMASVGISKSNIILDDNYSVNSDDRFGYSIQTGLNYSFEKNNIKVLNIDWTSEAVSANESDKFFNRISFLKDAFLFDGASSVGAFKISLFETFSFMKGIVPEISMNTQWYSATLNVKSFGIGISSTGILKILNEYYENKIITWFINNCAFDYLYAEVTHDNTINSAVNPGHYSYDHSFHSFQISFKNLNLFGKKKKSANR